MTKHVPLDKLAFINTSGPASRQNMFTIGPGNHEWQCAPGTTIEQLTLSEMKDMVEKLRRIAQDSDDGDELEEIADLLECDIDANPHKDDESAHPRNSHQDEVHMQGYTLNSFVNGCSPVGKHLSEACREQYEEMLTEILTGLGAAAEKADEEDKENGIRGKQVIAGLINARGDGRP